MFILSEITWRLGNERSLYLLFVVVLVVVPVYVWSFWRKSRLLRVFSDAGLLDKINFDVSRGRQILKVCLLVLGFISIIIALTEPAWNPKPKQVKRKGRDVAVLIDTSRSMLAEDIKPNRLERAKLAVQDLLEKLDGDRIGIITFAGNTLVRSPLTNDYAFIRLVLDNITTESTGRGGTNLGDAIRKASTDVFDEQLKQYKDIILITDGEDLEGSLPVEAAADAGAKGIRIIAVGLGNSEQGARIPVTGANGRKTFLKYEGREVWTKLDSETLRQAAAATQGGAYIPVETGTFDLGQIYDDLAASAQKRELEATTMMEYDEKFQIFLVVAILLIAGEALISERKKKN